MARSTHRSTGSAELNRLSARKMRDHQIAPFGFGLVQHLFGNIHGQQGLVHLVVGAADDKSRIVIRFLPLKWGKAFDDVGYLSDNHMS